MKKILFLLSIFYAATAFAQVNGELDRAIIEQADKMGKYFIAKDYKNFLKYTHPTVLALMGGEENALQNTIDNFKDIEKEGVAFLGVTFTAPSKIIKHDNEMQCILSQSIEMKVQGGTMTIITPVVAVSRDGGKNWFFADTSGNDITTMRKLIPNLSPSLVIPEPVEPVFTEDPETKP